MSEMVERVKKAICCGEKCDAEWSGPLPQDRPIICRAMLFETKARAAIATMREPTKAMILAARATYYDPETPFADDDPMKHNPDRHLHRMIVIDWNAMIDAALE